MAQEDLAALMEPMGAVAVAGAMPRVGNDSGVWPSSQARRRVVQETMAVRRSLLATTSTLPVVVEVRVVLVPMRPACSMTLVAQVALVSRELSLGHHAFTPAVAVAVAVLYQLRPQVAAVWAAQEASKEALHALMEQQPRDQVVAVAGPASVAPVAVALSY